MEWLYQLKIALIEFTGLSRDALHVQIGLLIYFGSCTLFRWKAWYFRVWLLTLTVALLNEASDLYPHYEDLAQIWIDASIHDMLNTMFAPTLIFIFARWSKVFEKPEATGQAPDTSDPEDSAAEGVVTKISDAENSSN